MSYTYDQVMAAQFERLNAEASMAVADLEAARQREDSDATMYAAQRILELDAQRAALAQRANTYVAQQQAAPQRHPSGLTDQEVEIAKSSYSAGTPEERVAEYARNKQKLAYMRVTGAYDDSQGKIFKR
jgi:cation transport regulator ChaC